MPLPPSCGCRFSCILVTRVGGLHSFRNISTWQLISLPTYISLTTGNSCMTNQLVLGLVPARCKGWFGAGSSQQLTHLDAARKVKKRLTRRIACYAGESASAAAAAMPKELF